MSNTITLPREYFNMKYRMAATAIWIATRLHSASLKSGLRAATSADALFVSRSSRSSIFTPRPFRPETSMNGFVASSPV